MATPIGRQALGEAAPPGALAPTSPAFGLARGCWWRDSRVALALKTVDSGTMLMVNGSTPAASDVKAALGAGDYPRAAALVTLLRLHWFVRLRWMFLALATAVLVLERLIIPGTPRPLFEFAIILSLLGLANLFWTATSLALFRRFRGDTQLPSGRVRQLILLANAQVAVDLLLLTCILRLTGGVESPLVLFYLFHMGIVSLVLERWQAVIQAAWALLLYAGLAIGEWLGWIEPHHSFLPGYPLTLYTNTSFVFTMLLVVACGIFGMLYLTLQISGRLEKRERMLREANLALQRSQTAIQDLQHRRSRFMQTAAHQLKSPLAVIQTLTELIRDNVVPPSEIAKTCDKIVRRCADGTAQVSELITLARVQEADAVRHSRAETDVRAVVLELCDRFKPIAEGKNVELAWHLPQDADLRAGVDRQDLSDCVGNLIENAIKYTPGPGSVAVTVTLDSPAGRPEEVAINVKDTGIGISPDILKSVDGQPGHEPIFEPFRRANNALSAGISGTGLGLSIVREVVEQAGGRISVSSTLNQGSNFTVAFPTARAVAGRPRIRDTRASEIIIGPGDGQNLRLPEERS